MNASSAAANLLGLVLAGGLSSRMGRDKGSLPYDGVPLAVRAQALLAKFCDETWVSIRPEQAGEMPYADMPTILDRGNGAGPAAGLMAAWQRDPTRALLVLAADMPFVDEDVLRTLIAARDPQRLATAYRRADGTVEPLCTIWEPAGHAELERRTALGDRSLRRLLAASQVRLVTPAAPEQLSSVNRPDDYATALRRQRRDLR